MIATVAFYAYDRRGNVKAFGKALVLTALLALAFAASAMLTQVTGGALQAILPDLHAMALEILGMVFTVVKIAAAIAAIPAGMKLSLLVANVAVNLEKKAGRI